MDEAPRPWVILAVATGSQAAGACFGHGIAFLIPAMHESGTSLAQAGTIAAMPLIGTMLTLVAWGAAADAFGERIVLVIGTAGTALTAALAALEADDTIALGTLLLVGGAFAASTSAASGRMVAGWFPPRRRGLAMGVRQMAQPLGVGLGAATMAPLSLALGVGAALWVPAGVATLAALGCAALLADPPRPPRAEASRAGALTHPYGGGYLVRIHLASMLLVIPQFTVWTFALVWLVGDLGWAAGVAGAFVAGMQLLGALGRIGAGQVSDLAGSRLRPMRWIALLASATMLGLAVTDRLGWDVAAVVLLVAATVVTVADNGLAYTAIAEHAGPYWSGRALGAQNTGQYLAASAVPPVLGALVATAGFAATFAVVAAFPLIAAPLTPVEGEAAFAEPADAARPPS
ncbi:sugar phosphate permease [Mumia flava]|uniref:Sugar phosphate permease n=1 Tax=Mumia flava TaxID=1348852 RepID=A0A0B2BMR7_9ACTN|nr:MFS transporter [Mumia flava]PJJ57952.1 sugar phosphate permease [Mumia flava]